MRRKIAESIGCCPSIITQSLNYRKATSLSNAIRNEAMRLGAKEVITADASDVLTIDLDGECLRWQSGDDQVVIDLANETITSRLVGLEDKVNNAGLFDVLLALNTAIRVHSAKYDDE